MRQTMAKALRRDLRRTIGEDAIETMQSVGAGLNALRLDFSELTLSYGILKQQHAREMAAMQEQLEAVQTCLIEQTNRLTNLEHRPSFWARWFGR